MVKEEFVVRQTKSNDETRYVEKGTEKVSTMRFKGVGPDGIVTSVVFHGTPLAMSQRFAGFIGSVGDIEVSISSILSQKTLAASMANATKKKAAKAKKPADDDEDADFEDQVDALTQP